MKKKKLKKFFENFFCNFFFDFFFDFLLFLRVRSPGSKETGSPESGHLKICRTSGPDVMSG